MGTDTTALPAVYLHGDKAFRTKTILDALAAQLADALDRPEPQVDEALSLAFVLQEELEEIEAGT